MIRKNIIMLLTALSQVGPGSAAGDGDGDGDGGCYYLDKTKLNNGQLAPLVLSQADTGGLTNPVHLRAEGLFHGEQRICEWSKNGGSGTKAEFALDGDFAVPLLEARCEAPFSHVYTGVGFGDWYLTLCGKYSGKDLIVPFKQYDYTLPLQALDQWTVFDPGNFPLVGDEGR